MLNSLFKIRLWLYTTILLVVFVVSINIFIDPLWIFKHENKFNSLQYGFNERLLKTAFIKYKTDRDFTSLLIGASRLTYFNPSLKREKIFNYSVSNMTSKEIVDFTEYFKRINHLPLKEIYLGLDFVSVLLPQESNIEEIEMSFLSNNYIFRNLFSLSTLRRSFQNIHRSTKGKTYHRSYDRDMKVVVNKLSPLESRRIIDVNSEGYYLRAASGNKYINHNKEIKRNLKSLIKNNKSSEIHVFTTPISIEYLDQILEDQTLKSFYLEWVRGLVEIFGQVYFYTYNNELAINAPIYSKDGNHYYPDTNDLIFSQVSSGKNVEKRFHILINKENIEAFINKLNVE